MSFPILSMIAFYLAIGNVSLMLLINYYYYICNVIICQDIKGNPMERCFLIHFS